MIFNRWGDTFTIQRLDLRTMAQTTVGSGWRKSAYAAPGFLVFGGDSVVGELWALPSEGVGLGSAHVIVAEHVDAGRHGR